MLSASFYYLLPLLLCLCLDLANSFLHSPVFGRTWSKAASFHPSLSSKTSGSISSTQYSNFHKLFATVSDDNVRISDLKSELCGLLDINGTTLGDDSSAIVAQLMDFYDRQKALPKEFLVKLLDHSIKHQLTLPNILPIYRNTDPNDASVFTSNLTVVGDVHGQYDDFAQIFQKPELGGYPSENNQFVFNGDLVDRGPMAVEIVTVLLVCKLLNINSVHILRGNHETYAMTRAYGFEKEVLQKYDSDLLTKFRTFFDALPVGAVVQDKIFVVHGGIGPKTANMTIAEINALDRVKEPVDSGPIIELLWSDPMKLQGFYPNYDRGGDVMCFGEDITRAFLSNNNLQYMIRSHQVMMEGVMKVHDDLCWTVFSAPNYCGRTGNLAAVVKFNQNNSMEGSVVTFDSVEPPASVFVF